MEEKERYYSVIDCNEDFVIRDCESGRTCKSLFEVKTLLNYQDREINRLTKMLYTTTKHADKLNEENNKLNKIIKANIISTDKVVKENQQFKQQLAEKEKEIAYLTKQVKKFNNEAQKYFEDAYCNDFHNQDKTSFAVEQLTQAKDYVQQYVNNFDDMNDCLCAIDNQIKRLTHQHEDKGE